MHNLVVLFYTIDVVNVTLISFVHTCVATKTIETTPTEGGGGSCRWISGTKYFFKWNQIYDPDLKF